MIRRPKRASPRSPTGPLANGTPFFAVSVSFVFSAQAGIGPGAARVLTVESHGPRGRSCRPVLLCELNERLHWRLRRVQIDDLQERCHPREGE